MDGTAREHVNNRVKIAIAPNKGRKGYVMSEIEDRVSRLEKGKELQDRISQSHQTCIGNFLTSIEALNTTCRNLITAVTVIMIGVAFLTASTVCLVIKLGN